ncbi:MAG: 30S ribosomal protein S15 [Gammaproteobacteria bacterium]
MTAINAAVKAQIIGEYGRKENDTGSPETQIALLTKRIVHLTEHVKQHTHDFHSRRGLVNLVSQRKRLLRYLRGKNLARYQDLIERLGLRDTVTAKA